MGDRKLLVEMTEEEYNRISRLLNKQIVVSKEELVGTIFDYIKSHENELETSSAWYNDQVNWFNEVTISFGNDNEFVNIGDKNVRIRISYVELYDSTKCNKDIDKIIF